MQSVFSNRNGLKKRSLRSQIDQHLFNTHTRCALSLSETNSLLKLIDSNHEGPVSPGFPPPRDRAST